MDRFLSTVELFAGLPEDDLKRLGEMVEEVQLPSGEDLFIEGEQGNHAYVIQKGQVEIFKDSEGAEVYLSTLNAGDILGEMSLVEGGVRTASARARVDSKLLSISREQFDRLLKSSPKATVAVLRTIIRRLRMTEGKVRQRAKMAQLGTITGSVSHELEEPAPQIERNAEQLRAVMGKLVAVRRKLYETDLSSEQLKLLFSLEGRLHRHARNPLIMDSLEQHQRESELEVVLSNLGIEDGKEYAAMLLNLGYEPKRLTELIENFTTNQLTVGFMWLNNAHQMYSLLEKTRNGAMRIYDISQALKSYSEIDETVLGQVDIYDELEDALFKSRDGLGDRITVERQYAEDLPRFQGYPDDLNQVFVHILSNAIDAIDGVGIIKVRPYQDGNYIVIEIEDNGSGIPEDVKSKLFDPFFTTKNPGESMGLGLHVSHRIVVQKHEGELSINSDANRTCVTVRLPIKGA
jgi:signal transduction histidine kinase